MKKQVGLVCGVRLLGLRGAQHHRSSREKVWHQADSGKEVCGSGCAPISVLRNEESYLIFMLPLDFLGSEGDDHEVVDAHEELGDGRLLVNVVLRKLSEPRRMSNIMSTIRSSVSNVIMKLGMRICFSSFDVVLFGMAPPPGNPDRRWPFCDNDIAKHLPHVPIFV